MRRRLMSMTLAVFLVIAVGVTAAGCGTNGAKTLAKNFFESIDKQDVNKFLKCFDKDTREEIEDYWDKDEIEVFLDNMDLQTEDEFGEQWIKKLKIGDVEKEDAEDGVTYYTVEIELDDEEISLPVMKVKGKFYVDEDALWLLY